MILAFANCVLAKSVFALGLFSVQWLRWFLCGMKFFIFLSELLRKPYPIPSSLSSGHMSTFWSQDSPAYVGAPCLLCFSSAVASCSRRLCQVRCACFSFPFQESFSGVLCSLWEEANWWPSSAPAITFLKGLHGARQANQVCSVGVQQKMHTLEVERYTAISSRIHSAEETACK